MENKKTYIAPQLEILVFTCADGTARSLTDNVTESVVGDGHPSVVGG